MKIKKSKVLVLGMLLVLAFIVTTGCGSKITADISKYEDSKIEIMGLEKKTVTMTVTQLSELTCDKKKVTTSSSHGEITAVAVGPTLETLLKSHNKSIDDFESVKFTASDGYVRVFDSDFFTVHPDIYLSLCNGDKALNKEQQPVRLIIPGVTSDNWVKGIVKIELN